MRRNNVDYKNHDKICNPSIRFICLAVAAVQRKEYIRMLKQVLIIKKTNKTKRGPHTVLKSLCMMMAKGETVREKLAAHHFLCRPNHSNM